MNNPEQSVRLFCEGEADTGWILYHTHDVIKKIGKTELTLLAVAAARTCHLKLDDGKSSITLLLNRWPRARKSSDSHSARDDLISIHRCPASRQTPYADTLEFKHNRIERDLHSKRLYLILVILYGYRDIHDRICPP